MVCLRRQLFRPSFHRASFCLHLCLLSVPVFVVSSGNRCDNHKLQYKQCDITLCIHWNDDDNVALLPPLAPPSPLLASTASLTPRSSHVDNNKRRRLCHCHCWWQTPVDITSTTAIWPQTRVRRILLQT